MSKPFLGVGTRFPLALDPQTGQPFPDNQVPTSRMNPAAPEYNVARTYLDWMANLPWDVHTEDNLDIAHAREPMSRAARTFPARWIRARRLGPGMASSSPPRSIRPVRVSERPELVPVGSAHPSDFHVRSVLPRPGFA